AFAPSPTRRPSDLSDLCGNGAPRQQRRQEQPQRPARRTPRQSPKPPTNPGICNFEDLSGALRYRRCGEPSRPAALRMRVEHESPAVQKIAVEISNADRAPASGQKSQASPCPAKIGRAHV